MSMRIGIVCPYDWQVPGGVQAHVRDLALCLMHRGHTINVLAPADEDDPDYPEWFTPAGRAVPVPFNGSVARVKLGPGSAARVRTWMDENQFDVVHVHEPLTPGLGLAVSRSLSLTPVVGTFHAAAEPGFALSVASTLLSRVVTRLDARIVVSGAARSTLQAVSDDADVVAEEIPNFVDVAAFASGSIRPEFRGTDGTIVFLGRVDEPRKGLEVLLSALPALIEARPHIKVLIAGPGDVEAVEKSVDWHFRHNVSVLGLIDEQTKRDLMKSADVYVAPHLGGESFGIVLIEAMAAGAAVVASDLPAFTAVVEGGVSGRLFETGNSGELAEAVLEVLSDNALATTLVAAGLRRAGDFDTQSVVDRIERVYASVTGHAHQEHVHDVVSRRRRRIAERASRRHGTSSLRSD